MQEMQPSMPPATPVSLAANSAMPVDDDFDFALGCECAYPSLQIERWQELGTGAEPN
jgi:hypothetical protein